MWVAFECSAFERIDQAYLIQFGESKAPIHITEYFAFDCYQCIHSLYTSKHEFEKLKEESIDQGQVFWTFHPDPSDLFTLQVLVAFDCIPNDKKQEFFWDLLEAIYMQKNKPIQILYKVMGLFTSDIPNLEDLDYLRNSKAFIAAANYLQQADIVRQVPTIEVNQQIYKEFPSFRLVKKAIAQYFDTLSAGEGAKEGYLCGQP